MESLIIRIEAEFQWHSFYKQYRDKHDQQWEQNNEQHEVPGRFTSKVYCLLVAKHYGQKRLSY